MSKVCEVTGKKPLVGNNVSHANNKTKRLQNPNLKNKKYYVSSLDKYISLKLSTKGIKIIDKIGIEAYLKKVKKN